MAASKGEKAQEQKHKRQWRFYRTGAGNSPVKSFLDALPIRDVAEIVASMKQVEREGTKAARHLRTEIWEVRVDAGTRQFRVLFAEEGKFSQVLLALEAFQKTTQKTPPAEIELAESRLRDWRERGRRKKK
jgi:phage-related protein